MNDIQSDNPEYAFVEDPLSDQVWDMWTGNATKNTETFRQLFRADPDDYSMSHSPLSLLFYLLFVDVAHAMQQSKPSTITPPSSRATTSSSRAICTTPS